MLNPIPAPNPSSHQRSSSRSNSASSSSIVTVQRAASLSSRSGSRLSPQHPPPNLNGVDTTAGRTTSNNPNISSEQRRRQSVSSGQNNGFREGIANVNRWSQSTSSSKGSAVAHNRKSSFSRRLSLGGAGGFAGLKSFNSQQSPSRNVRVESRQSPNNSPRKEVPRTAAYALEVPRLKTPVKITLPALSQAVNALETPSSLPSITPTTTDVQTPPAYSPGSADYFGSKWTGKSPPTSRTRIQQSANTPLATDSPSSLNYSSKSDPYKSATSPLRDIPAQGSPNRTLPTSKTSEQYNKQRRGHSRNRTDSLKGSGGTEDGRSSRSEDDRERRHRGPSQKVMLSKALQKANTAVQLDNAQNFEGAMEAYAEACELLQQVMSRSPGEDDRRKLDAIVCSRMLYLSGLLAGLLT